MKFEHVLELVKAVSDSKVTSFQYEEGETKISIKVGHGRPPHHGMRPHEEMPPHCGMRPHEEMPPHCGMRPHEEMPPHHGMRPHEGMPPHHGMRPHGEMPPHIEEREMQLMVEGKNVVESPLVGTFYVAPSEDAEPFVKVGDIVKKGQTLAIIEAMKLMNEIESDYDGEVVEILVNNGQGVEYGQPLFIIE